MAEAHRFTDLEGAVAVFPDLHWRRSKAQGVKIFDAKAGEFVSVSEGDYIVSVGDRYEVSDKKPRDAKKATVSEDTETEATADSGEAEAPTGDGTEA